MDYLEINRNFWNNRVEAHYQSDFYDIEKFIAGKNSIKEIELKLLGDITNKNILHLQCHFGQDTISLERMGAKVTGIDLSDTAIAKAKELNAITNTEATFACCDVYSVTECVKEKFDIVFSSYGTICWLPDLAKWAKQINNCLKPGGKFVFAEFHPVVWMFDDKFKKIEYSYFNRKAHKESSNGSYTDQSENTGGESVFWNHELAEVISALLYEGLTISHFSEYDYSPFNCFENTVEVKKGRFQIKGYEAVMPMAYALIAEKQGEVKPLT